MGSVVFELTGRRALVTGAGDGMGVGIVRALARQGAAVAANDLVPEPAAATVQALEAADWRAVPAAVDVTDERAVQTGMTRAADTLGGAIDILVNSAGVPPGMTVAPFREMPRKWWARYIDLDLYGSLYRIAAAADGMVGSGWAGSCRCPPAPDGPG